MTDIMWGMGVLFIFPATTAFVMVVLHHWFTKEV